MSIPGLADTNPDDGVLRRHPRSLHFAKAKAKIGIMLSQLFTEYELTPSERVTVLSEEISSLAYSCMKSEREKATEEYKSGNRSE